VTTVAPSLRPERTGTFGIGTGPRRHGARLNVLTTLGAAALLVLTGFASAPTVAVESPALLPPPAGPAPAMAAFDLAFEAGFTASREEGVLAWGAFALAVDVTAVGLDLPADSAPPSLSTLSITAILYLSAVYDTNPETLHIFLNGLRVAKVPYNGAVEYYAYDALGNVRVVMGSAGARTTTLAYRPFGVAAYGSEPKYAYTGEYRESAPNLVYLHSRWYDPTIGRFISPDDRLGSLSVPQSQNRYVYVVNNPMKYTDPTGHDFLGDLLLAVGLIADPGTTVWLTQTDDANRAGFVAGVLTAFAIGLVVALVCVGARNTSRGFS